MVKEVFAPLLNRPVKRDWRPACQLLFLVVLLAAKSNAQGHPGTPSLPTLPSGAPANSREDYDIPSRDPAEEYRRMRALNAERQKDIVSDAKKLVKLTTEFNAEIVRTNPDSLNKGQLHKLAEIEKVARDLKAKMSTPVWVPAPVQTPLSRKPL